MAKRAPARSADGDAASEPFDRGASGSCAVGAGRAASACWNWRAESITLEPVSATEPRAEAHHEPHDSGLASRLNWLRAGVLGANDGVVSTAAIVLGVAGATAERGPIILAGLVGLMAGAMSMAVGE